MSQTHLWILYDERAHSGDTDRAVVLVACDSEKEARGYVKSARSHGWHNPALYRYDVADGDTLIHETYVPTVEKSP